MTTARECAWTAASEAPWLSIIGSANGQGDGSFEYRAAANADPVARRAAILANNQRAEITQAAGTCTIELRQPSGSFPPDGGTGRIEIVASSQMCPWAAESSGDWITIATPRSGTGNGIVTFSVAATSGPPRTGVISISGQRFSIIQSQACTYSISPVSAEVGAAGGTGRINVFSGAGCPWTAFSNAPWVAVSGNASGEGPGSIEYAVAPTEGPARTATLVVAGQTFTLTQGAGCSFDVSPLTHTAPSAGGTLTVNVTAADGCPWIASAATSWITIVGGASGSGSAVLTLSVAASTGPARTGTVTIAGRTVTVTQGAGCTFAISPESANIPAGGGSGSVAVTAPGGCAWSASSNADWIAITQGSAGSGDGTVGFTVAPTTGAARSGTVTIAGRTFTLNQGSGCAFTLVPQSANAPAGGGVVEFDVQTDPACSWTVASNAPWISILGDATNAGSREVRLSVAPNTTSPRAGTVSVSGSTFTVNQAGACTFTIAPPAQNVGAAGGDVLVNVGGPDGCNWTAVSGVEWIGVTSGASGSGSGTVQLTVAANLDPARTGTVTIAGSTFTVDQASGCSYALMPSAQPADLAGGPGAFTVETRGSCPWNATADVPWIRITTASSGVGPGTIEYVVDPNPGTPRAGTITVQGMTFTVNQGGM